MSDYIPFEVQLEIFKRLPVKSLLQFRSVSKRCKSLIDSSEFIAGYGCRQTQSHRLLVWYEDPYVDITETGKKIVAFLDDKSFVNIEDFAATAIGISKHYRNLRVVGSSRGLVCLYDFHRDPSHTKSGKAMVVLWNPSIRKSVDIVVPRVLGWTFNQTVFGFGVCPITSDPTIVKITQFSIDYNSTSIATCVPLVIEVFKLSTESWRILSTDLPNKLITVTLHKVAIDKYIYWFGYAGEIVLRDGFGAAKLVLSFDMTTEEFRVVDLPDSFTSRESSDFSISKLHESLAVFEYSFNNEGQVCDVWVMDHDGVLGFTKLITISTPYILARILGFTNSGALSLTMQTDEEDFFDPAGLEFYDPCLKHFNNSSIFGKFSSFFVDYYMETLVLLQVTDCPVFSDNNSKIRTAGGQIAECESKKR